MPATAFAAYPGANGKIVFSDSFMCSGGSLYTVEPDGSARTRLTTTGTRNDCDPAWSPDGARIAFHSETGDDGGEWTLRVMNADGAGLQTIEDGVEPTWSPDGTKLAFSRYGAYDIFVRDLAGGSTINLTNTMVGEGQPAWSPDGTKIAFQSYEPGSVSDVYVMNPDGSGRTRLTTDPGWDADPSWSPDGRRIAFTHQPPGAPPDCTAFPCSQVHVMNADGSGEAAVTSLLGANYQPAWSPDGTKIAFHHITLTGGLYVMNTDGSDVLQIPGSSYADSVPDWQPLPLPEPAFKNSSKKCKGLPGDYRNHGQCVKANR
jgi:Tol biopolymer transport system component